MNFLSKVTITLISALIALPTWAQMSQSELDSIPVDTMIIEGAADAPVQKVQSGYFEANEAQVQQIIYESIEKNRGNSTQLLVTTDSPTIFTNLENQINQTGSNAIGLLTTIQTGESSAIATPSKESLFKRSMVYAKESVGLDPIGVIVTTVVVGADIFMWVHASQYSNVTIAGNILIDLVVNVGFGLRKNAWAEMNNKIAEKAISPILRSVGFKNLTAPRAELFVKMISNFTMVITVQAVRLGFIVAGGSSHVLMGSSNFHYTELVARAGVTAFLVAAAFSFNNFGWENWIAKNEKFGSNKIAKFLAYRFHEIRTLKTGVHITSAALMSPNVYGYASWAWVAANGTVGLAAYLYNDLTSRFLLSTSAKIAKVSARFSDRSIVFKKVYERLVLRCETAFAI